MRAFRDSLFHVICSDKEGRKQHGTAFLAKSKDGTQQLYSNAHTFLDPKSNQNTFSKCTAVRGVSKTSKEYAKELDAKELSNGSAGAYKENSICKEALVGTIDRRYLKDKPVKESVPKDWAVFSSGDLSEESVWGQPLSYTGKQIRMKLSQGYKLYLITFKDLGHGSLDRRVMIQKCNLLETPSPKSIMHDCDAQRGHSGSPLVLISPDNNAEIVGINQGESWFSGNTATLINDDMFKKPKHKPIALLEAKDQPILKDVLAQSGAGCP